MGYRWKLHLFLLTIVKCIQFDNGFALKTDSKLIEGKTTVDLLLNFTEPIINVPNMTCNGKNITEEVNIVNKQLEKDFRKFIHSLDLNIPDRWKFINHFCNCWGEDPWDHMGDPRLACCVENKRDVRQLEHCTHDLTKRVHWDNKDMDSLISMCIRVPIPYFLQIFQEDFLNNLNLNTYSKKILKANGYKAQNDDAPDFNFKYYQSGIKPYISYNVERLLDHNMDTYMIFQVEKSPYYVNYNFTATWLENPGFETVIIIAGMLSDEDYSSLDLQKKMRIIVTSDDSSCDLYDKNLFKNFRRFVDFVSLIFHCPKHKTKTIGVSFEITTFSKRLHEIAIIRNSPLEVVNVYDQNLVHRFKDYQANGDHTLDEPIDEQLQTIQKSEDTSKATITSSKATDTSSKATETTSKATEIVTKPSVDNSERKQFFENIVNLAAKEDENEDDTDSKNLPLSPPIVNIVTDKVENFSIDDEILPLSPIIVDPELYEVLTDDEDLTSNNENISYVDSSGYLDIDEWVALRSKLNSLINYRNKRSIFRKISNFIQYWATMGPITNIYNSDRMDISDQNVEEIAKQTENNSGMILHLDSNVKRQTKLLSSEICETQDEIHLNFLELKAGLAFLEMKTEIIEIIDQCRNKKLPLFIAEKFSSENCLQGKCDDLISCERIGLGLQLTKQRQLHIHLKIAIPKNNSAKIFRILPLKTQLSSRLISHIPDIESKSFNMVTSQVINLPKNIVISNNKILGGTDSNDKLISISNLKPTCLLFNGTFISSKLCHDVKISYVQDKCLINEIPEVGLVQIISQDNIRIFDKDNRHELKNCNKSCFIKPGWFTPDCFSYMVVNNSSERFSTFNLSVSMSELPEFDNRIFYQNLEKNLSKLLDQEERENFIKNIHEISGPIRNNWNTIKIILFIAISLIGTTLLILICYYGIQFYLKQFKSVPIFDIRRIN